MKTTRLIKVAAQSIIKNKMRTVLTMLGIVIGVAAVIVMVAVGHGARTRIAEQIQSLGNQHDHRHPGIERAGRRESGGADLQPVAGRGRRGAGARDHAAVVGVAGGHDATQVIGGEGDWRTSVHGVSALYPAIRDWPTSSGAFWSEADDRSMRRVAVLGATVANALYPGPTRSARWSSCATCRSP